MLIRYPGSKDRQAETIIRTLDLSRRRLCEPFAGTAAVTFACIRAGLVDRVWINDADRSVAELWSTVRDYPDELCRRILGYVPSADSFYAVRDEALRSPMDAAFALVVLHQISYSGLGRKAGSPIGGRSQTGAYKVDCRWNAQSLTSGVHEANALLNKVHATITNVDWSDCPEWTWYVDPPYFDKGPDLYRVGVCDHIALHDHLMRREEWWSLSYDNVAVIRDMYELWAHVDIGGQTYLGKGTARSRKIHELLITPCRPAGQLV